jgi:hypothetical protein
MPVMRPRVFFTGQRTTLFLCSGSPSVPRSVSTSFRHRVAWRIWLSGRLERPATQPRSLMLKPAVDAPPSVDSSATS